jgi:DNA-binding protein H-NS
MSDHVEVIKVITNIRSIRVLARELGFEAISDIIEKFKSVQDEMREDFEKEAKRQAEVDAFIASIPEDLRADIVARFNGVVPAAGGDAPKKERKQRAPSETITCKVKDQIIEVKMAGKVNDELKAIMEDAGFTTQERKQFVEKFRIDAAA